MRIFGKLLGPILFFCVAVFFLPSVSFSAHAPVPPGSHLVYFYDNSGLSGLPPAPKFPTSLQAAEYGIQCFIVGCYGSLGITPIPNYQSHVFTRMAVTDTYKDVYVYTITQSTICWGGVLCTREIPITVYHELPPPPRIVILDKTKKNPDICLVVGNPIHPATGNKQQVETDYSGMGLFPLVHQRTYNSAGELGAGWRNFYDRTVSWYSVTDPVTGTTVSTATVTRPNGKTYTYTLSGSTWVVDADISDRLTGNNSTDWTYTSAQNDETEIYSANGALLSITNRAGLTQTLAYDTQGRLSTVTDPVGRQLTFTYDTSGRMATLTDPASGLYLYTYDVDGNLSTVTYPDGKTRTYLYNEQAYTQNTAQRRALTGIIDENNSRYATFGYNATGLAISTEHAGGVERVTVNYGTPPRIESSSYLDPVTNITYVTLYYVPPTVTTVTDALGTTRGYDFQSVNGVIKNTGLTQPCPTCGGDTAASTYDANGNPASKTDFNGNVTTYGYDLTRNLEISRTEAAGTPLARITTTTWHPTFRLPTQITEPNRVTTFTYDTQGNLTQKTITSGTLSRTWSYTYNALGLVTRVNGPRSDVADVTTYTYDAQGNLASVTNALGHVTNITTYDAHGRPLTIQDPNGVITQLRYDVRGRLISRLVGTEFTQFQYDGVGQLTRIILPDSSFMDYRYDAAHRLIAMTDALGNKISYTLDALGNRIKEDILDPSNALTQQRRRVFDGLNRLAQDIGAQNQVTAYQYDANGNLLSRTDPLANTTTHGYDALNRLAQVTDSASGIARYTYNANDRLIQAIDPRGIGTAYSYDGLDNLTQTVSLDAGTSAHTYDTAGNLATQTDARNKKTVYTYDALNRLIQTRFADATRIVYQYDTGTHAIGRLIKMTDPAGITQWTYDPQGRVITQTQTTGTLNQVLRYGYDASGRVAQLTYPSGKVISYGYDLAGNLAQLGLNGQPLLNNIRYQPYGAVKEWTWGNGTLHSRAFDADGRMVSHPQGNAPLSISYDSAGRIVQQTQSTGVHSYGYDSVDRLTQHVDATGLLSDYQYDTNGNRTQLTQGSLATAYHLSITSNRLNSQSGAVTKSYTYDAAGNLISNGTHAYTYNARGRLAKVTYGTRSNTYALNGLGQRIRKTGYGVSTGTNRYVYDAQGHLLGDYTSTGVAIQETVYLGDIPVAVLQGTAVYHLHADHLDTPRVITDSTDKVIWRWDSDPFGTTAANEDPDGDRKKFIYNLRFPGQYFDKETGLHYNYFRDYDPRVGRYVQSDPIGLRGGLNTYTYVDGNPISYIDPLGLAKLPPIPPRPPTNTERPVPQPVPPPTSGRPSCDLVFSTCMAACVSKCPGPGLVKVGACGTLCVTLFLICKHDGGE